MDIDKVRELVRLMVDNDLAELDVTEGENKVRLRRGTGGEVVPVASAGPAPAASVGAPVGRAPSPTVGPATAEPVEPEAAMAEDLLEIKSPMVGTFYGAASPETEPYVSVGAEVAEETVVCIVEAMKVMNEIKAECAGTVAEVCVRNAQPVEYGQVLFRVRPA